MVHADGGYGNLEWYYITAAYVGLSFSISIFNYLYDTSAVAGTTIFAKH